MEDARHGRRAAAPRCATMRHDAQRLGKPKVFLGGGTVLSGLCLNWRVIYVAEY